MITHIRLKKENGSGHRITIDVPDTISDKATYFDEEVARQLKINDDGDIATIDVTIENPYR